jgi:general secretion pathway protein B
MSFILDALKKSENERQRTVGPSLADAPVRRHQPERPWWMIAVGALLVVNLGVLLVVLLRDKPGPVASAPGAQTIAPAAAPREEAPARSPPPQQSVSRAATNPAVHSLAEEANAGGAYYEPATSDEAAVHPDLAAAANVPEGPPLVRPIEPPAVAPLAAGRAVEPDSSPQMASEVLPTANALTASGTVLPDLRLDIHVYSNKPSERFVFINMHKYTEGDTLTEGPVLERITPEGAVLNQHGLRYVLPRQ